MVQNKNPKSESKIRTRWRDQGRRRTATMMFSANSANLYQPLQGTGWWPLIRSMIELSWCLRKASYGCNPCKHRKLKDIIKFGFIKFDYQNQYEPLVYSTDWLGFVTWVTDAGCNTEYGELIRNSSWVYDQLPSPAHQPLLKGPMSGSLYAEFGFLVLSDIWEIGRIGTCRVDLGSGKVGVG